MKTMKTHKEHEKNTKTTQQKSTAAVHEDLSQLWWRGYAALDAHALLSLLASKLEATPSSHQDGFPDGIAYVSPRFVSVIANWNIVQESSDTSVPISYFQSTPTNPARPTGRQMLFMLGEQRGS